MKATATKSEPFCCATAADYGGFSEVGICAGSLSVGLVGYTWSPIRFRLAPCPWAASANEGDGVSRRSGYAARLSLNLAAVAQQKA